MSALIKSVKSDSPAGRAKIAPGEMLIAINGEKITDVLDYQFASYDGRLTLTVQSPDKAQRKIKISKGEGEGLGLDFDSYLMDEPRRCKNKCIFCFVDQLPKGMRKTLYFKDDDARLSFLLGNYITLTNLSEEEAERIIRMRISPINISVHTTDPALRERMLGNPEAGRALMYLYRFAEANIMLNCQIVVCPGINDGRQLEKTLNDLTGLCPSVQSISVVPVGITKYREKLMELKPVYSDDAMEIINIAERCAEKCLRRHASRVVYPSDELFITAGLEVPDEEYYEEFPQLENGVGSMRLFFNEFMGRLKNVRTPLKAEPFSVATGAASAPYIRRMIDAAASKCDNLDCEVVAVTNHFFGEHVTVSGLLTGSDYLKAFQGRTAKGRILISSNSLRHGGDVFLDDISLPALSAMLGTPVIAAGPGGMEFFEKAFPEADRKQ